MEPKRRGYRESEGGGATVPLSFMTPRKRSASSSFLAGPRVLGADTVSKRVSMLGNVQTIVESFVQRVKESGPVVAASTATAMVGVEEQEPLQWRGDPITTPAPDLTFGIHGEDEDNNSAMAGLLGDEGWSIEQNAPKEVFLPTLLKAYDIVHAKYSRTKARKIDIEAQFEEQRLSHERFQQVADGYIQDLCSENQELRKTLDAAEKRMKWLESLYLKSQKDDIQGCETSAEVGLQKAGCESDVAASPARPLTPTTNKLAAEGEPAHLEVQLPSQQVSQLRTEVAECRVGNTEPHEIVRDKEIEETQDIGGHQKIARTEDNNELQVSAPENEGPRENVLDLLEPSRSGEEQVVSTQKSVASVLPLDSSLKNARSPKGSAAADPNKAIVIFPDPISESLPHSNEAQLQDLHRREDELQDLYRHLVELQEQHRKNVELLDLNRKEVEFQDRRRKEIVLQDRHRKEFEQQQRHRKEVTALISESEMLQKILGFFLDMKVVSDEIARKQRGTPALILSHSFTGFRFRLEILKDHDVQEEVGKELELSYRNLSLGTLVRVAPWWMKEELVFSVDQLVNFVRKFQETVTGCK
uniref:DUF7806 domain-containing protein n=1 Tax=Physcomitrium patens TaxID=3218 RepID=A0A2K1K6X1_PHYPA|nr:hypothetical protein PHYPA_011420 [Physcomitrium patens]